MASKRQNREEKYPTFTTEIGTLSYPHLTRARDYKDNGNFYYDTTFVLEGQSAAELEKLIDRWVIESGAQHKTKRLLAPPYDVFKNEDDEVVDGATAFRFKVAKEIVTAKGTWERKPAFYDAAGNVLEDIDNIGSGTECRIAFQVYRWKNPNGAGVSLQPVAVQIIKLVEYQRKVVDAGAYGFGEVEGGFVVPDEDDANDTDGDGTEGVERAEDF